MISCQRIIQLVEKLAPKKLAMEWDNPGLALGSYSDKVSKILLTLTVTEKAIKYAVDNGFDMIISHHPLFFKPIKSLTNNTPLGKIVYTAIKNDINIYSSHTNMDIAQGGVNDILAKALGLKNIQVLKKTCEDPLKKIVVFVPKGYEDKVRDAMADNGAGHIGNYSHCSFNSSGFGTFKPLDGTTPFIGEHGKLEKADEIRLETIVPKSKVKKVVNAMIKAHPYEEVAYDIYPLENEGRVLGLGRIGLLDDTITLDEFCKIVKEKLYIDNLRVVGDLNKSVTRVALCGGAGSNLISTAAFLGADVFVTGDVKYHEALDALDLDLPLIDAGHFATENLLLPFLQEYLSKEISLLNKKITITIFKDEDPFTFI